MSNSRGEKGRGFNRSYNNTNDTSSCRGHYVVLATCDAAREREGSKELVNLLQQAIEVLYPLLLTASCEKIVSTISDPSDETKTSKTSSAAVSIQQLLAEEIASVKNQAHKQTQLVVSIKTEVKGLVLAKIMHPEICPVSLVKEIFNRVRREAKPCSRYLARFIPLQRVFYPNEVELLQNMYDAVVDEFPGVSLPKAVEAIKAAVSAASSNDTKRVRTSDDPVEPEVLVNPLQENPTTAEILHEISSEEIPQELPAAKKVCKEEDMQSSIDISVPENGALVIPDLEISGEVPVQTSFFKPFSYSFSFKARNNTVLNKAIVEKNLNLCMPTFGSKNFRDPQVLIVVEAVRNICGISFLREDFSGFTEFSIRKFQALHAPLSVESSVISSSKSVMKSAATSSSDNSA